MCGAAYNPALVTNKPKIHGVAEAGEVTPIVGRGGRRRGTRVGPYAEEREVGSDLHRYTGELSF